MTLASLEAAPPEAPALRNGTGDEGVSVRVLRLIPASLLHYQRSLGLRSKRSALAALASAVGSSLGGPPGAEVRILVRTEPEPILGILTESGIFDAEEMAAQARSLDTAMKRLRYVDYREVDVTVRRLAQELVRLYGNDKIRRCRFTAIPRGGFVVLGLLASALGLRPAQIGGTEEGEPLVIVDDCALTGARFGAFLAGCEARQVVFAHLASHPALRAAVEAREPRVLACVAAFDLREQGREDLGSAYATGQARWRERLGPSRYWIGDCDQVCFPWNEPDRLVWNPERETIDTGWKLIPPRLCLQAGKTPGRRPRIEVQPAGRGSVRPSRNILFGRWKQETIIARLGAPEVVRLAGSAAALWWALVGTGSLEAAGRLLLRRFRVSEDRLQSDLFHFYEDLLARGLIENDRPA